MSSTTYATEHLALTTGGDFVGYLKNFFLDTDGIQVPLLGSGLNTPLTISGITSIGGVLRVRVTGDVPASITGNVKVSVKNLTTSAILGYANIGSGTAYAQVSTTAITVSDGDQVALEIVSTAGSGYIPFLSWEITEGE